jgi:hypothetical protein
MRWLGLWLVVWLLCNHANATSFEPPRIQHPAHLEAHAAEVQHFWAAANAVQLETGGTALPQNLCLEDAACVGLQLVAEPEPSLTGLRSAVAWLLERAARPPPVWFWAALVKRQADARPDVRAEARLRVWLLAGAVPSLPDLNISYSPFVARAEFGAGFGEFLLMRFGLPKLKTVLRFYYANLTLSDAFLEVLGVRLEDLFAQWLESAKLEAQRVALELGQTGLPAGVALPNQTSGALVWTAPEQFVVARGAGLYGSSGQLLGKLPFLPNRLGVAANGAIVYARPRALGGISGEVFVFAGQEHQLTHNAAATDAAPDGECVIYVRAFSSLWRWCAGVSSQMFAAPTGWRLAQPAVLNGKIALTVTRGMFTDVAVWADGKLEFQTSDVAFDQHPVWLDSETLLYSSDRLGTAQLWRQRLGNKNAEQVSAALGGAFAPTRMPNGRVSFESFVGTASQIHWLEPRRGLPVPLEWNKPSICPPITPAAPSLLPEFGLAFSSGVGLEAKADVGAFFYRLAGGYDLFGTGFGADFQVRFAPVQGWRLNLSGNFNQQRYSLVARATWFGTGEVAGERVGIAASPFATLENGVLIGWFDLDLGASERDPWGYITQRWQFSGQLNTRLRYALGLSLTDAVAGGFVTLGVGLNNTGWSGNLALRGTYSLLWRVGDGVLALERLTIVVSGALSSREQGLGVQVLLDGVLNYTTLFVVGLEVGVSSRGGLVFGLVFG